VSGVGSTEPPRSGGAGFAGAGAGNSAQAAVSVQGLSKRFERGNVLALDTIDLDVAPGEFVSLIGPSGCGKSTLLRIVGDLIQPTQGVVLVNGKDAHQARLDRDYGIVFQDAVLYDWRTVARNIALPLEMAGWDRRKRADRVAEMLELVELTGFADHHPWQLSGGMQQRVSIARALSFSPALLLMDEPFGALDEMTRERMNGELLRIWQDLGATVVFVTHSIAESVFLSTRVVVMSARPGRIAGIVEIDLPQPRDAATREHPRFAEHITHVRRLLRSGGLDEVESTEESEAPLYVAEEGL
jgi:NitT/TauT family transport system ATP-binding protein